MVKSCLQGHSKTVSSAKWWHKALNPAGAEGGSGSTVAAAAAGEDSGVVSRRGANLATYVISGGLDGMVFFWLIDGEDGQGRRARRQETPIWTESDICQICSSPFFWNIKKMWTDMAVGVRQVRPLPALSQPPSLMLHRRSKGSCFFVLVFSYTLKVLRCAFIYGNVALD